MSFLHLKEVLPYFTVTNTLVTLLLGLFLYRFFRHWMLNLPPGPIGFPILGIIPFLRADAEKTFAKWSKKYGPVMSVQLGSLWTVVLNSYEAIDQAYIKQATSFSGRHRTFFTDMTTENYGIIFLQGEEEWKAQRKFGSKALSGTALQGKSIEARIIEEAEHLCERIQMKKEKPFILELDLIEAIADVINGITVKEKHGDGGNQKLKSVTVDVIENFRKDGLYYNVLSVLPWSRFLPFVRKHMNNALEAKHKALVLFKEFVKRHEYELDPNAPRDFTDLFLINHFQNLPTFENPEQLLRYLVDLFVAGTETTTSTIRWILLYLIKYPEVQRRVHEEIDEVAGSSGAVKLDLPLSYTKAVIQEGYRIRTATPLSVPRSTRTDVTLMGYHIPKNTQIIANLWAVHNDPDTWPDPDKFDPERHLDESGNFVKHEKIIPFSIGSRNCLGENLARSEVFLFLVMILQKFEVLPNPKNPIPDLVGVPGVVYSAPHYPLIMKER